MTKQKKIEDKDADKVCEACWMDGYEVLADWRIFWKDPDCGTLSIVICENCYKLWKEEFIKNHEKFRSRRIKRKRAFIFR